MFLIAPLAIAGLASAGIQAGVGLSQYIKGRKLGKTQRPEYEIPQGAQDSLSLAKEMANYDRLPGAKEAEDEISAGSASAVRGIQETGMSSSSKLAAISAINTNQNKALRNLAVEGAKYRDVNKVRLGTAYDRMARYQDEEFNVNQMKPYLAAMDSSRRLKDTGIDRIMGGIKSGLMVGGIGAMGDTPLAPTTGGDVESGVPFNKQDAIVKAMGMQGETGTNIDPQDYNTWANMYRQKHPQATDEQVNQAVMGFMTQTGMGSSGTPYNKHFLSN